MSATVIFAIGGAASAFSVAPPPTSQHASRLSPLFMGRAAAVRAATKSKTDAKKAKTNAIYGKKIIMAVKQGGGPDPTPTDNLATSLNKQKLTMFPLT